MNYRDIIAEAWGMTRSQRTSSTLTVLVVAAMCMAVLLTAGRTNASQQEILQTIDSRANTAIIVRIEPRAEITMETGMRLRAISELSWIGIFGAAQDVSNPALDGSAKVASRTVIVSDQSVPAAGAGSSYSRELVAEGYDADLSQLNTSLHRFDGAITSPRGARILGLLDGTGFIAGEQTEAVIAAIHEFPDFLQPLDPLVLQPVPATDPNLAAPAALIIAVPRGPEYVPAVADSIRAILAPREPDSLGIETSEQLHTLSALVESQLSGVYRTLVVGTFTILVGLVTALLYGLVMIRRRDYGRRRALGATRGLIMSLVMMNTAIVAIVGALLGTSIALIIVWSAGTGMPGVDFIVATAILAVTAALIGSIIPGLVASRRDPLAELRVP